MIFQSRGCMGELPKQRWRRLVCNKEATPKSRFFWLAVQYRSPITDRLISWGIRIDGSCRLCVVETECVDHAMHKCAVNHQVVATVQSICIFQL